MNLPVPTNPSPRAEKKNKGGRPKGSRNRSSHLLKSAQIEIEKLFGTKDFDPAIFLQTIAADANKPIEIRIIAASKVLPYIYSPAKPAVIEDNGKKKRVDVQAVMSRVAKDLMLEGKIKEPEASSEDTEDDDSTDDNESPDDEENEDDSSSNDTHPDSE